MSETRALDTLYGFIWALCFALSIFVVNSAWAEVKAPENATRYWFSLVIVFIIPLVVTATIWVVGRITDIIYVLTTGWFGCLYSMFYTVYLFLMLVVVGVLQPSFEDPSMLALALGWIILPFLLPGIIVWILLKKYSTVYKEPVKKDLVYIFGYLYIGIIFMVQFYAYTLTQTLPKI